MIKLQSGIFVIEEVKAKTKAKVFSEFKQGEKLRFHMEVKHSGSARGGGVYASYVLVENVTTGETVHKSQSELTSILSRLFVIKEETE